MSDTDDDLLGIEAFQHLTRAVDRFGATLQATEQRQKTHADAQAKAATEILQAARGVLGASENALEASKARTGINLLWTGLGALGVVLVAFIAGQRSGQSSGWDQGHAAGYTSARDEIAAASWASTPNGQRAFALDRLGSLNKLLACSEAGWKVEKRKEGRVCFPFHEKEPDGPLNGWLVP